MFEKYYGKLKKQVMQIMVEFYQIFDIMNLRLLRRMR